MRPIHEKPETPATSVCEQHGTYFHTYMDLFDKFIENSKCPECQRIAAVESEEAKKHEVEKLKAARNENKRLSAGISRRHLTCSFKNFISDNEQKAKALNTILEYSKNIIDGNSSCLVMAGTVGTGKTHLASALANSYIESGRKCRLIKMSELIREIKDTWRKDSDISETKAIERFSSVPLLIIDEIGIQFGSDTEKLLISEIIDNRYQDLLPTVLISNLDLSGIKACIGERSYDRLREDGGKVIAFNWDSYRGKASSKQ